MKAKHAKKYYYDVSDAINRYPDAVIYGIVGGRNTGKTYSALVREAITEKFKFVFVKRTIEDVKILCAGSGNIKNKQHEFSVDLSPFVAINRDYITNIRAFSIIPGLGAFFPCDEDNNPTGEAIGYIVALNAVSKVKGFDLSVCDEMIFDEFIPQPWDRINRREGEQLMELYKTVSRDREHRGKPPLKLILLANATMAQNPVFDTLEVVDKMVEMQLNDIEEYYDEERGIYLQRLETSEEFRAVEEQSKIYRAMTGTQWAAMALDNSFAYDDFSNVKKLDLRKYKLMYTFVHKRKKYYIYNNGNMWYISGRQNGKAADIDRFDLSRQVEAERFYYRVIMDLRVQAIEDKVLFDSYSIYDLFMNYKKHYNVGMR